MGYCSARNMIVYSRNVDPDCQMAKEVTTEELNEALTQQGWAYCLTCKTTVPAEEIEKHANHVLAASLISDEALAESPPAD
ncbi:hypothetical protein MA03_04025 [Infirmifilum uzonense]|uniref:Uncharacterized protein n=2 Tax=Infirmifilum uzonense TaxID=1550241 RepID=A0A0F7FHI4_9CREN|nr:hypothetical protein MA03_04025 [Infirmifilum uzonense]